MHHTEVIVVSNQTVVRNKVSGDHYRVNEFDGSIYKLQRQGNRKHIHPVVLVTVVDFCAKYEKVK